MAKTCVKGSPTPARLSARSRELWVRLHAEFEFSTSHQDELCERALRHLDLADTLQEQAREAGYMTAQGARALSGSRDASATALKFLTALKLQTDEEQQRRLGRPSDTGWSRQRAQAIAGQ